MKRSLSALLPVGNDQLTLAGRLHDLLEILPELTDRFEIVIVDDGSTDATIEVADSWVSTYPQVKAYCHVRAQGRGAAIETGIAKSQGEMILLIDEDCESPLHELHRLFAHVGQHAVILGILGKEDALSRMASWRQYEDACFGGYQLIDRRVCDTLRGVLTHQSLLRQRLESTEIDWLEVQVSGTRLDRASTRYPSRDSGPAVDSTRFELPELPAGDRVPRRPNYLGALKQFAWGE